MIQCPKCQSAIETADVNMSEGVALCRVCESVIRVQEIVEQVEADARPTVATPAGAWESEIGDRKVFGASTRSSFAFFMIPFMVVWSGFSLGGIYGTQIASGQFSLAMSLFGIPFVLGSILFWTAALMAVCGKVEVTIHGADGDVFTGIGPVGWRRKFRIDEFNRVSEYSDHGAGARIRGAIALEGSRRLVMGSMLNEARRYYMVKKLEAVLAQSNKARRR